MIGSVLNFWLPKTRYGNSQLSGVQLTSALEPSALKQNPQPCTSCKYKPLYIPLKKTQRGSFL